MLKYLLALLCFAHTLAFADSRTDQQITELLSKAPKSTFNERLSYFSQVFIGAPYSNEPLGEGENGEFNRNPLYRLDKFDCETYVDTVLALALANNLTEFKILINAIRYADDKPSFTSRNHFTDADWLPNNTAKGWLKNISKDLAGLENTAYAQAYIDKKAWYQALPLERIQIPQLSLNEQQEKLAFLHSLSKRAANNTASLSYIPLTQIFVNGQANLTNRTLLAKIPTPSIILIVRPNWPIKHLIGTNMNVSHMGFLIRHNGELFIRAASSRQEHAVVDLPLIPYLQGYLGSTVKGISVLAVKQA